jgi:hypothetical protein
MVVIVVGAALVATAVEPEVATAEAPAGADAEDAAEAPAGADVAAAATEDVGAELGAVELLLEHAASSRDAVETTTMPAQPRFWLDLASCTEDSLMSFSFRLPRGGLLLPVLANDFRYHGFAR